MQYMIEAFNCKDIDGTKRLAANLEILCDSNNHKIWQFAVGLPGLLVWGLGIPLFGIMILTKDKERLEKIETREKYGFLYRGYKHAFFYWECVIMYRKIVIIFISVFIVKYGAIT